MQDNIRDLIHQILDNIPFNQHVGIKVGELESHEVSIVFDKKPELIGNPMHEILHGGMISTSLDLVGGLMTMVTMLDENNIQTLEEAVPHIRNLGTIDLRVDYIRPGRGNSFRATAQVLRKGSKIAVARMELHNDSGDLIAVGTGTYLVG